MTKIYVGNLPFSADETQVRQLFEQHGTVDSVALINDRETGRPRGFGFVEMPRADAQRAIQSLNGKEMGGRPLRVNEAAVRVTEAVAAPAGKSRSLEPERSKRSPAMREHRGAFVCASLALGRCC
jgi:RNA recognition motif-containing protein